MSTAAGWSTGLALLLATTLLVASVQAQPQIGVSPASIADELAPAETAQNTLTVTNDGDATLDFVAARGAATSVAGGPDAFGYTWTDSDQPGGPLFLWQDIRATGTHHPLQGTGDVWVDLPFDFSFYGQSYSQVKVYANGLVTFSPTYQGSTSNNRPIPWWDTPNLFIAGYWTNLNPSLGGGVYTGTDDRGRFVVQYHDVARAGGEPGRYTFQIILDETGTIVMQFGPMTGPTDIGTVGIENANSTTGLEVTYNAPYVYDGLAVRIAQGDPWFFVESTEHSLAPGSSVDVPVTLSSHDLAAGTVGSTLELSSNDPATPVLGVPVDLTVLSEPGVSLSTNAIDFAALLVGATATDSVLVTNTGTVPLNMSSVATDGPPFSAELSGTSTLEPGQSRTIYVTFEPTADGTFAGSLAIGTDHPDEPVLTVALSGEGLVAPSVAVSPSELNFEMPVGEVASQTVTFSNEGASDLTFDLSFDTGGAGVVDSLYYDHGWTQAGTAGFPPGQPAAAANRFTADGTFRMNAIGAVLRVQHDPTVLFRVYGEGQAGEPTSGSLLWEQEVAIPHTSVTRMYEVPLDTTLVFEDGEDFYIVIERESQATSPFGNHHLDSGRSYYRYHGGNWQLATHTLTFVIRALTSLDASLSAEPMAGTVAPGSSLDVDVTVDASALPGGEHLASLVVASNDPIQPEVVVPIAVEVMGEAGLVLTADSLHFGEVYVGHSSTLPVRIRNLGTGPVTVSEVVSSDAAFTVSPADPFTLPAGASDTLHVTFSPLAAGAHDGVISVTSDDPQNPSIDLVVEGDGVDFPSIVTDPESISVALVAGESAAVPLTITNDGDGPLEYAIEGFTGHDPAAAPDGFGYTWTDSRHAGGPVFDWVDISGTGTALELGNNTWQDVELPFIFPFYGDDKMVVRIASNGYLTFGNQRGDVWQSRPIPHNWPPDDFIAPFWTSLDPGTGGTVYHSTDDEGRFVVQYDDVSISSVESWRVTFQVILDQGGNILFQYLERAGPFSGTIGIENADASDGLEISHNQFPSFVTNGLAVRIDAPTPWLTAVEPAVGTVAAGESVEVELSLDSGDLEQGIYPASLRIASNDASRPLVHVPVTLEVAGSLMIPLSSGWNLVSFNVEPDDMAVEAVLGDILEHVLAVATYEDGQHRSFVPGQAENSISHLMPTYGYWVKVSEAVVLEIEGEPVDQQHALELIDGMNAVSYLPWRASGVEHALETVLEVTASAAAFQGTGITYAADVPLEFHVMDRMRPRAGYVIRAMAPGTLIYPTLPGAPAAGGDDRPTLEGRIQAEQQAGVQPTLTWLDVWGEDVRLQDGSLLPAGSLITAETPSGLTVGAFTAVAEGRLGLMPIYGDDPYTPEVDGAQPGQIIALKVDGETIAEVEWTMAGDVHDLSGNPVGSEPPGSEPPSAIALEQNFPNPFRATTTIRFGLPEAQHVRLTVYDALGRRVSVLEDGELPAGMHDVTWNAAGAAAGVYFYRLEAGAFSQSHRMVVLR